MQSEAVEPLGAILGSQNPDGGWGYQGARSWTEPTVYALLALLANDSAGEPFHRGIAWLERTQREDGGWPPHGSVGQSTWVTALAVIVCAERIGVDRVRSACGWLLSQSGRESGRAQRLRQWLLGVRDESNVSWQGWAWYPGAAAWAMPTAVSILALEKVRRMFTMAEIDARIRSGREFLMARRCDDGGWNYGVPRALGQAAASYPETTGVALLSLHGLASPALSRSLDLAERHLSACASAEGQAWLELGLMAHGRTIPPFAPVPPRRVSDAALLAIAAAAARGRHVLVG